MSGGSLNYLYRKDADELWNYLNELEEVEDYLLKNNAYDVAKDVRRLIEYIKSSRIRIEVLRENLSDVFKAIEWHQSGDYGKDSVDKAIEKYRKGE